MMDVRVGTGLGTTRSAADAHGQPVVRQMGAARFVFHASGPDHTAVGLSTRVPRTRHEDAERAAPSAGRPPLARPR